MREMTNTNDFRRYSYHADPTYLINNFNLQRGSQAPDLKPKKKTEERELKLREGNGIKSKSELKHEQRLAFNDAVKLAVVAMFCLALIGLVINSFAVKNELTRKNAASEVAIANAQSEYISLESELDALVSMSMIDKYAVEQLGMVKVKSNQIQYIDVSEYKAQREMSIKKAESKKTQPKDIAKNINLTKGNK